MGLVRRTYRRISLWCINGIAWWNGIVNGSLYWLAHFYLYRSKYLLDALRAGTQSDRLNRGLYFDFRRNIHRLEKGLSFSNPRSLFAEEYIQETVDTYAKIRTAGGADIGTLHWSEAVLAAYFSQVEHSPTIERAYHAFRRLSPSIVKPDWKPYLDEERPPLSMNIESLRQLALRRRSIRTYLDKRVDAALIAQAMEIALMAPSACNRQPFRFLFCNEADLVHRIAAIPGGVKGYHVPSILLVIGQYRAYFDTRDIMAPIIDASMACMSLLLALETLGLSSVCINWPNLPDRDKKIRSVVPLSDDEFVVMLIGIGYGDPKGKVPFSAKRQVGDLVSQITQRPSASSTVPQTDGMLIVGPLTAESLCGS